ncbi:UPF0102 protein [Clostridia bacterium]|nr:UPF0102 protein [Clostridia bacterium]
MSMRNISYGGYGYKNARDVGCVGEARVCAKLESSGYVVIARNYRASRYEIDIVAENEDCVCFVEVKTRSGMVADVVSVVTIPQRRRIMAAAERFCLDNDIDKPVRFDVALVPAFAGGGIAYVEDAYE